MTDYQSIGTSETKPSQLPDHLIRIADPQWGLWRWVGLRGTGFTAVQVLKLANTECAAGADRLIQAQDEARQTRSQAIEMIERALERADADRKVCLERARRRLQKNKAPDSLGVACAPEAAIDAFQAARARLDVIQNDYARLFRTASRQISCAIREVADTPSFLEAVTWQSRQALHTAIGPLLSSPAGHNSHRSKDRQTEELIAMYLQRYCTKNDTIGFFGPVGWARLNSWGEALIARPGPNLLLTRNVYFEAWCIDEISKSLAKNRALLKWAAPRLSPAIRIEGQRLYSPSGGPVHLSQAEADVLQACNGGRTAKEIALAAIQRHPNQLGSESEAYKILDSFSRRGLILWNLEAPLESHPAAALRRLLEPIEDEDLRGMALNALTEIEDAKRAVADATGDAERLDSALEKLEAKFTQLTGKASTRSAQTGRTLVYEDCRRDIEVEIGPEILSSLGPPLALLLTSARWLSWEMAVVYRKVFQQTYTRLVDKTGSAIVDFTSFWVQAQPLLFGDQNNQLLETIVAKLQKRWANILNIHSEQGSVTYTSEQLRPQVLMTFDAPGAGWTLARYHSPDVMIAAGSVEAIQQGQYQLVMGELHVTSNTLAWELFLEQHPSPEDLFLAIDLDLPEPRLSPLIPRNISGTISRVNPALIAPKDFRLELFPSLVSDPESQVIPCGAMVIEDRGGGLIVRTRDGAIVFDVIETFADFLSYFLRQRFNILSPARHTPRIVIDNLVVCRESWHWAASAMEFAFQNDSADRFLAARRWAQAHNIPRFVFIKAPVEKKPVYVDFDSPIYVDIFAKIVRRTAESKLAAHQIGITEMLPRLDQAWLPGPSGERYTSELRIIALDLAPTDK